MSTLKHVQPPEPVSVDLKYHLSDVGVERHIAKTGKKPTRDYTLPVRLPELEPNLRARAAAVRKHIPALPGLRKLLTAPSTLPVVPELDEVSEDPRVVIEAWERLISAREAEKVAAAAAALERQKQEEKARVMFRAEMAGWIALHGSERLKTAFGRGYRVTSLYLQERAAHDFPGFAIDANRRLRWEERANPTAEALAIENYALERAARIDGQHRTRVVWLTHDLEGNDLSEEGRHKRETVIVTAYLGFYTLLRDAATGVPS